MSKKIASVGLALLLALSLTACGGKKGADTPAPPTPVTDQNPKAPGAYQVNPIGADAAPQALKDWAAAEQGKTQPAYKVHEQNGVTYLAVTAGQQSSGGWTGAAQRTAVAKNGTKDELQVDVVWTPPAGMATMALTNPVIYFRAEPAVVGEVKVQIAVTPTSQGQHSSSNFTVDPPRLLSDKELLLKGKARAFEGVFIVEVRHGGEVITRQSLKAKAGAPEYGDFEHRLTLDRAIPAGAEVWFITESMKDSSDIVELVVPIYTNAK